ncbi:hypothetical protein NKR74_16800 [Bacillus sp. 3103sda1]|uniref:hypothetical protein n=1 Tax=Bacillus sp. 3103sda1 TaxID=2953808 RepID=UPI00209CA0B7|nr:hypothetical protein [Bacillus sp. 3103sda1]MCP1124946.1 hypothetical protein [Bacillus sp. 3103sda1]
MNVSKEGKKFLIDMKVYLLTKGIKEDDINNFLEDAELHLIEGEKEERFEKFGYLYFGCAFLFICAGLLLIW